MPCANDRGTNIQILKMRTRIYNHPNIKVEIYIFNIKSNELNFERTEWSYFNFVGRGINDLFTRSRKYMYYVVQHDALVRL